MSFWFRVHMNVVFVFPTRLSLRWAVNFNVIRDGKINIVTVAELQVKDFALDGRTITHATDLQHPSKTLTNPNYQILSQASVRAPQLPRLDRVVRWLEAQLTAIEGRFNFLYKGEAEFAELSFRGHLPSRNINCNSLWNRNRI